MFLIVFFLVNGISGKIQGSVIDEATNEPIEYVNVCVLNTEMGTATDENGNFFILNVPSGEYIIEVTCMGYQTVRIENVKVELDEAVRLKIFMKPTTIEMPSVTITGETPVVKKDMVGSTYIVRKEEITYMPFDYTTGLVSFQPSVAHFDTAIHVRGGRATEVLYLVDNVSIIDPQTGDPAIALSKGIIDEVIFLPGGFDAEYGRAMSGVINLITERPKDRLSGRIYGKTETIMPYYYDFGYQNYQSSVHLPITKKFRSLFSMDIMHTDDWDPKLFILPHKQRDDYSFYSKCLYTPTGKLSLSISGIKSRIQFDRYNPGKARLLQDHGRSDLRKGDLQSLNINYLPDSRKLFTLTLGRLYSNRRFGVRNSGPYGIFEDYTFRHYYTLKPYFYGNQNPWGVWSSQFFTQGDYSEYQDKTSQVIKTALSARMQLHEYHELKTGYEFTCQKLENFDYLLSNDTLHPLLDTFVYSPIEHSAYVQDDIDYKGVYGKVGCRYDYYASDIEGIAPQIIFSPRLGFSFLVTEKFLFRANIGRYAQPPLYDYMYGYYRLLPAPQTRGQLIGNPHLKPEKTTSYEIGLQGEVSRNMCMTVNSFYKDITDLVGTRVVPALPYRYVTYMNMEYGNARGIEAILDFKTRFVTGKASYTLSWARGTSSYATEVYYRYYYQNPDTNYVPPTQEYYLDFDQRHRFFIQGTFSLPGQSKIYVFSYIGNGFPYTPPGSEGKLSERNISLLPFQRQIDCVIVTPMKIGRFTLTANIDIINILNARYEISPHTTFISLEGIHPGDFHYYYTLKDHYYHPAADFNHDGILSPYEEYTAYRELVKATDDWVNAYTAPRRVRIGIAINF